MFLFQTKVYQNTKFTLTILTATGHVLLYYSACSCHYKNSISLSLLHYDTPAAKQDHLNTRESYAVRWET